MEKAKEAICNTIRKDISFDDCMEKITINGIKKGSVIIDFQIENNKESIQKIEIEQVKKIFTKDSIVDGLDMKVKDTPVIIKVNPNLVGKQCASDTYKHNCPYGTYLKKNAYEISGSTNKECCDLDLEIIKYVIPGFLILLLFIYIMYSRTFGKILNRKSV